MHFFFSWLFFALFLSLLLIFFYWKPINYQWKNIMWFSNLLKSFEWSILFRTHGSKKQVQINFDIKINSYGSWQSKTSKNPKLLLTIRCLSIYFQKRNLSISIKSKISWGKKGEIYIYIHIHSYITNTSMTHQSHLNKHR